MSDNKKSLAFLPRVKIRRNAKGGSFALNFSLGSASLDSCDPIVRDLILLADDWTSYCVTSLQFIPGMSQAGFLFVDHALEEADLLFLSDLSVGSEETIDEETGEKTFSYVFQEDDISEVAKRMETTTQMLRAARTVQRSTLSSLIAEFDFFFSKFLRIAAAHYPERFYDPTEQVSIKDLSEYGSISEVIETKIEKTISRKMRGSHEEFVNWAYDVLELEKEKGAHSKASQFKEFLEVCQRRHVMTHNGGEINAEYVRKCSDAGLKSTQYLKVGDDAVVDAQYLRRATARVYLVGFYAIQMFIQTSFPKDRDAAYSNLLSTSHTFLENDQTKMALRIIDFAEFSNKHFSHDLKLKFGINRALAKLFNPDVEPDQQLAEAKIVLEKYDWSVRDPIFDLALACISRNFEDLIALAKVAANCGLSYSDMKNFTIFREAREIEGFIECFPRTPLMIEKVVEPTGSTGGVMLDTPD